MVQLQILEILHCVLLESVLNILTGKTQGSISAAKIMGLEMSFGLWQPAAVQVTWVLISLWQCDY